jgi:hypothetical protein
VGVNGGVSELIFFICKKNKSLNSNVKHFRRRTNKMAVICFETGFLYFAFLSFFIFLFSSFLLYVVTPSMKIRDLCLASSQWSSASVEDKDPLTKVIHASFGLAFFNSAKYLSSDSEILKLTGIQSKEFMKGLKQNLKVSLESVKNLHKN